MTRWRCDRRRRLWAKRGLAGGMTVRVFSIMLGFVVPLAIVAGLSGSSAFALALGALSAYTGVFVERWLYFAEARHVVNLYHGA